MTLQEIEFEDIRKGDIIRTRREFDDGFVLTMEGEATYKEDKFGGGSSWRHKDTVHGTASDNYGMESNDTFYLINREEPKDHVVIGIRKSGDEVLAQNCLYTKSDAETVVESLHETYRGINNVYGHTKYVARKVVAA